MKRIINYPPSRGQRLFLGILPFILIAVAYLVASEARLSVNPTDKLMPGVASFVAAMQRMMFEQDRASGALLFWWDTYLSLWRLFVGLGLSALMGLVLGTPIGFIPQLRAAFDPVLAAISLVPPLAVLPILFILFGLGEVSKIVLIVFGVAPFLMRDVVLRVDAIPREQIIKAQTLGGSTWHMLIHVVLPQVMPGLINAVRLSLGATWLFVIAAEAITAEGGLGYRIFLVRRYLAMDIILPYVIWITLLAFVIDLLLRWLSARLYPWSVLKEA
ncbi:NitT/TauT family transport system permease protein [Rhizobium rosettiformans]|uniref:ABC transporter permease subunit n=2 Tax=Rhizobium rosettiformans TaxID=1368430 RepID=A0A4S8PR80_9HYPH|nr:ABC transporter permease subunit [Rhizobium rosettiformans]MBB5277538.1 NitT/TauT family transport system permease protein [Rhizobium rosettiformans]THV33733.1 ABC transporter permease subunit [Rhizobium rosettiformans W3]